MSILVGCDHTYLCHLRSVVSNTRNCDICFFGKREIVTLVNIEMINIEMSIIVTCLSSLLNIIATFYLHM